MSREQIIKNINELERRYPNTIGRQRMITKNVITSLKMKLKEMKRKK